jgi:hypothetical protein
MFGLGRDPWAQSKQQFDDQFELDGDHFLYRRWQKGPPIRVTADERQRFIDDYARRLRYANWGIIGGLFFVVGLLLWWTLRSGSEVPDILLYAAISTVAVMNVGYSLWAGTAPNRELNRRAPVGRERTREEMRRMLNSKTSYSQLAGIAFVGAILPFGLKSHPDVFHGWGRLWLLFSGIIVSLAAVAAFRKWRFERNESDRLN